MTNVIMLVRDRFRLTEQALNSLYTNTPRDQFNLTIVDDESGDFRVRGFIEAVAQRSNATALHIYKSEHVLGKAKNLGVSWSEQTFGKGDWLYLSDNDVYFTLGWLKALTDMAEATEGYGFRLWGGQIHPYHHSVDMAEGLFPENLSTPSHKLLEYQVLDGPSWLMRWGTWKISQQLSTDTAPGTCKGEDVEFCKWITSRSILQISGHPERTTLGSGRIGVIHPFVVYHTGLTNTAGEDAPGRKEREAQMVPGVLYE